MMADQEGLLSRWSRRKSQPTEVNDREDELLEKASAITPTDVPDNISLDEPAEEAALVLTDADMPDIDTLHEDSDFSQFMSPGVSDKLRNLALRKMFAAPIFNIRDGLDEYDEDYTSFEPMGDIITSDMKHQLELEAQKQLDQAAQETQARADIEELSATVDAESDQDNQAQLDTPVLTSKQDSPQHEHQAEVDSTSLKTSAKQSGTDQNHE